MISKYNTDLIDMWHLTLFGMLIALGLGVAGVVLANLDRNEGELIAGLTMVFVSFVVSFYSLRSLGRLFLEWMGESEESLWGNGSKELYKVYMRITRDMPEYVATGWGFLLMGLLLITQMDTPNHQVAIFMLSFGALCVLPYPIWLLRHDYLLLLKLRGRENHGNAIWAWLCCGCGSSKRHEDYAAVVNE